MSAALETTLEWPRFCYTGPSLFEDNLNKKLKKASSSSNKRLSSSSNTTESDEGESGSLKDEQMVPINKVPKSQSSPPNVIRSEFAFSDLMRKMASKYQQPTSDDRQNPVTERAPLIADMFTAALSQYLPPPPTAFLPTPPFMPFSHLTPALETLAGSRALSALAQAQKRLREQSNDEQPEAKKRRSNEDPLDLSSTCTTEDDVDVLSIDPPSPLDNVDNWSVDKVVDFVSCIESCKDYAQAFRDHSIDGSALMVLNESHLTKILGLKLGPAIRLRTAIQDLKTRCSTPPQE